MKILFTALGMLLFFTGIKTVDDNKQSLQNNFDTKNKKVVVYTTAQGTDYRMSVTDTLHFTHMGQPFETQVCVFVDPSKTFQRIIGFGGAITDAAAETF